MIKKRLNSLRQAMAENNIDVYYFNTSDYHMSEYVPAYFRTLAYFSGFTGSLATMLVDKDKAYLFVDGRYHLQADKQAGSNGIEIVKLGTEGAKDPLTFIYDNYKGKRIGLDGKRCSISFALELLNHGFELVDKDIYSVLQTEREPLKDDLLFELAGEYTGLSRKEKLDRVKYCLGGKCHIINNLESIAYLLNLRGNDVSYTPVFMSFLIFIQDDVYLFVDKARLDARIMGNLLDDEVIIRPYEEYYSFLKGIKKQIILMDKFKVNYSSYNLLYRHNKIIFMRSIVEDMKAIKNSTEINGSIKAHIADGLTMVKFLKWLKESNKEELDEYAVSRYLDNLRIKNGAFDLSFGSIVAYNANAAMMHYAPMENASAKLDNKGILLVDSGGQYLNGTTDITRTIALGPVEEEVKKHFCAVLTAMFAFSSLKFLKGLAADQLDVIARRSIWELGLDYRCGTGHGIGQTLAVHELPPNVRYMKAENQSPRIELKPGHIFSDEPGIYLEGKYGIRIENVLLCQKEELNEYGQFLSFRTLTLCPIDLDLIDKKYLDERTLNLLNDYHFEVYRLLSPYLNSEEKEFLAKETRRI